MTDLLPILPGLALDSVLYERPDVVVYRGYAGDNTSPVVVKVLRDWDASSPQGEAVERAFAISSSTPLTPIVRSLRTFDSGYQRVVVMEDCGAVALREVLAGRPHATDAVLALAISTCDALEQLHQHHVYHGLVSPDHLLVHPRTQQVNLIGFDYGSASSCGGSPYPPVARRDAPYAAPELAGQIQQEVDQRADLYSLGVTMYEALAGSHPFVDLDPLAAAHAHVAPPPGSLQTRCPELPAVLCELVEKLLAVVPSDRYQSALGLKSDLLRCLEDLQKSGTCTWFRLGLNDVLATLTVPAKLYGRDEELATVQRCFARCEAGAVCFLTIAGPPGIGKTRIVESARVLLERRGALFVGGKVEQFGRGKPFAPLVFTKKAYSERSMLFYIID